MRNTIRLVALGLSLLSILGPWGYSDDGVPPPEWCTEPAFLLESDRCVRLLPGSELFSFLGNALLVLPQVPSLLANGEYTLDDLIGEFIILFVLTLLVLPIFTTLAVIVREDSRRLRILNRVAWALAAIPTLLMALSEPAQRPGQLWGVWLYVAVVSMMLALELVVPLLQRTVRLWR